MAAALLAAGPSPLPPASWGRRPLLAAPLPALRCLRAPAYAPPGIPPPPRKALAPVARAVAPARGRGEATEEPGQAPRDWGALAGRLALGALLGSAALLGCRGGRGGLHQGVRLRAAGGGVAAEPRLARRRRRLHTGYIAGARAAGSDSGWVLDAPSPRPADRAGSFGQHGACAIHHPLPEETRNFPLAEKRLGDPDNGPPLRAGTTEGCARRGVPVARADAVRRRPVPRHRSVDRRHHRVRPGHAVLVRLVSELGGSGCCRVARKFAHEPWSEVGHWHRGAPLHCISVMWGALRGLKESLNT